MFLGVDPWQPLLLQSSFITVKFHKKENKRFSALLQIVNIVQQIWTATEEVYLLLKACFE